MIHKTAALIGASLLALAAAPAFAQDDAHDHQGDVDTLLAAADEAPAAALPAMSFGSWGVDPLLLAEDIKPGDDFNAYVNKRWIDATPLPADFSRIGAFVLLGEKSTYDVKALMDELMAKDAASLSGDERRILDTYRTYLDTGAIEAAGLAPAQPYLARIKGAKTLDDLAMLWAEPGFASPVGGGVGVDAKQPDRHIANVGFGGLGMPDRDYYLDTSEKGVAIQAKYKEYLTFLLGEAGYANPAAMAETVYAFEDTIARKVAWDRTVRRNRDLTYNLLTADELSAIGGKVPVTAMLTAIGIEKSPGFVVSLMPPTPEEIAKFKLDEATQAKIGSGLPGMFALLGETPVETLQAWMIKEFLSGNAAVLPARFDAASFEFFGKTLRGTPEQRPRWKRAIGEAEGLLGELIGKEYVARYFPAENKVAMDELVANLRLALRESIGEIDWMGAETKTQALAKLDSFDPKIGYRPNLETYDGLAITGGDPIANRMAAAKWGQADNVAKLGQPIDRTEWGMLPQTVNAYYNSVKNEIVFPAGILQQPFFALSNDIAVNYGAIGGVIGHEMGHGFDDQGSKSDATGMLRNWWTDTDRAAFDKLGDRLVAQYNSFCPLDEGKTCVNGRLTLGENIGDVGGLSMAYRAYKIATKGMDVPVIDGLTGDQRFFLAWAQVWRSTQREANYRNRLVTDSHSPEEYRVNGVVRNLDEWYDAFGVKPGDAMYLPPEERVRIW
ncbi:putative endopeptidase [Erythromicrobium ramosum]|uniref:Endopeptidase n=1 Tax=Erythrobacter ramosus TaxID=35811 RepID=A0A6I4UG22_9SPHN|nr:M13 family metallopeptidase [Erythrobacter ramosus]MBB3774510.1 putative endopeptidase [Erythrobacter ramosus]MXP37840.1 M13 family peptidase [Erythrobacter ramosus]